MSDVAIVIACPRSGTTWLRAAMGAHGDVLATEHRFFGDYCDAVHDEGSDSPRVRITMQRYLHNLLEHSATGCDRDMLLQGMVRVAMDAAREGSGRRVVVETITPYLGTAQDVARGIGRCFHGAPVVHLVRDGRDVLVSGVMHWLGKSGTGADEAQRQRRRAWLLEGGEPMDRLFVDEEIVEWTNAWREAHESVRALAGHKVLQIRYEQMLADQAGVLRDVLAHIGVLADETTIACCVKASSFEAMTGGRANEALGAHVRQGSAGDWKRWLTRRDSEVFVDLAGDLLMEYGYAQDASWAEALPERLPSVVVQGNRARRE